MGSDGLCMCGCGTPLPVPRSKRQKYLNPAHRNRAYRAMTDFDPKTGTVIPTADRRRVPEHVAQMKRLAIENLEDEVREVMREEIRSTITQHVRDNVLGAAEVLTHMAPRALAAVQEDLESDDWMIRSRAYALWFKYVMPLQKEEAKEERPTSITVISGVPVPDTPLGHRVAEEVIEIREQDAPEIVYENEDGEVVESYEKDWPRCATCRVRKHPENMRSQGHGVQCSSCIVRNSYKRGDRSPIALIETNTLYGN